MVLLLWFTMGWPIERSTVKEVWKDLPIVMLSNVRLDFLSHPLIRSKCATTSPLFRTLTWMNLIPRPMKNMTAFQKVMTKTGWMARSRWRRFLKFAWNPFLHYFNLLIHIDGKANSCEGFSDDSEVSEFFMDILLIFLIESHFVFK